MRSTSPLGIAVLGSGAQALRAAGGIRATPALNLVGLWSRDPERARKAGEAVGAPSFHDLDRLLATDGLKAVFIAAESDRHAELGLAAAKAGKHVLVDKPIDASADRTAELVAACRERKLVLSVVAQKRFTPRFRQVREAIASGALGRIVSATLMVRTPRPDTYFAEGNGWRGDAARGGGVLLNQGIHWTDLLCWWLGEPAEVRGLEGARREGLKAPETLGGVVRFAGGVVATLVLSTAKGPGLPEFIEIVGEKGAIQIEGGRMRVWDVPGQKPAGLLGPLTRKLPLPLRVALTAGALSAPVDGRLEDQLAQFASAVAGGSSVESSGEEGLRALKLAQALSA